MLHKGDRVKVASKALTKWEPEGFEGKRLNGSTGTVTEVFPPVAEGYESWAEVALDNPPAGTSSDWVFRLSELQEIQDESS